MYIQVLRHTLVVVVCVCHDGVRLLLSAVFVVLPYYTGFAPTCERRLHCCNADALTARYIDERYIQHHSL